MFSSRPNDVIVLGFEALSFVRLRPGKKTPELVQARRLRLKSPFARAAVTPEVSDPAALTEALRRLKMEVGSLERVALLLPDSWFRINILDFTQFPDKQEEADEVVRWALKRTLPIPPELLRVVWIPLRRTETTRTVLAVSAVDKTLKAVEELFRAAGIEISIIEPFGLNVWNAISSFEGPNPGERLFLHVAEDEFTTAMFRGEELIFIRSRNLHGERSVPQEIRLSASYLRDNVQPSKIETCYLSGTGADEEVAAVVSQQFGGQIRRIEVPQFVALRPGTETTLLEPEIVASTGVFRP
jgi:Tfp pilus assembly PilM family ATPase